MGEQVLVGVSLHFCHPSLSDSLGSYPSVLKSGTSTPGLQVPPAQDGEGGQTGHFWRV